MLLPLYTPKLKPWMSQKTFVLIDTEQKLQDMCKALEPYKEIAIDTETTGLCTTIAPGIKPDKIVGYCFCGDGNTGYYVPVGHNIGPCIPLEIARPYIQSIIDRCVMIGFNLDFDRDVLELFAKHTLPPYPAYRDVQILLFLLDPDKYIYYSLKDASHELLGMEMIEFYELFGYEKEPPKSKKKDFNFADIEADKCLVYAASDAICTYLLYQKLKYIGESGDRVECQPFISKLEHRLVDVVRGMKQGRIYIDIPYLLLLTEEKHKTIIDLENQIKAYTGDININSGEQLGRALFEDLGIGGAGKTPKGKHCVSIPVIEKLKYKHPVIGLIIRYRQLNKQVNDYVDKLIRGTHIDGMARFGVNSRGAPTGRFSAPGGAISDGYSGINIQSIPSADKLKWAYGYNTNISLEDFENLEYISPEEDTNTEVKDMKGGWLKVFLNRVWCFRHKKKVENYCVNCPHALLCTERCYSKMSISDNPNVRGAFRARPGYKLVAIDFQGVELRIASFFSKESIWLEAFKRGADLHQVTADAMGVDRNVGKTCNFQILYGCTGYGLAAKIDGITPQQGDEYIHKFYKGLPTLATWIRGMHVKARQDKYIKTFFGRYRNLEPVYRDPKNKQRMSFGDRSAVNTPVQGSSADVTKICMVKAYDYIHRNKLEDVCRMVCCVHDEIVYEVHDDHLDRIVPALKEIMCLYIKGWPFALSVDIEIDDTWGVKEAWTPKMYEGRNKLPYYDWNVGAHINIICIDSSVDTLDKISNILNICAEANGSRVILTVRGKRFYLQKIRINKDRLITVCMQQLENKVEVREEI